MLKDKVRLQYGRHESFPLRTGWLSRGFRHIQDDPKFFSRPDVVAELGLGKNMVNALRYWCLASNFLNQDESHKTLGIHEADTGFGAVLMEHDPYLEDPASIWLLHASIATNWLYAPFFSWTFNSFGLKYFTKQKATDSYLAHLTQADYSGKRPSPKILERDFQVLVRSYVTETVSNLKGGLVDVLDCPLRELGLIHQEPEGGIFSFRTGPKASLPAEVVAFSIFRFLYPAELPTRMKTASKSVNLDHLLWNPCSPGMLFKLDGESLIHYVEEIRKRRLLGEIEFDASSGMQQIFVRIPMGMTARSILKRYYSD